MLGEGNEPDPALPDIEYPGLAQDTQPVFLVDCGNFMAKSRHHPELKARTHLEAMKFLGASAVIPGHEELNMDTELAIAALGDHQDMLTSCNLTVNIEGLSVSKFSQIAPGWYVIGVSSWEPSQTSPPATRWWELADPVESVSAALAGLPEGAKAVVFATNQDEQVYESLAQLDVTAVVGYEGERRDWPAGSAPVYKEPQARGEYLELVTFVENDQLAAQEAWRIKVSDEWPDQQEINQMLRDEQDERLALVRKEREEKWGKGGFENIDWNTSEKYLPQKNQVEKAAERGEAMYMGIRDCARCHKDEYTVWMESRHAHGFISLMEGGSQDNLDCLACHSTGLLEPGGYDPFTKREAVAPVSCESCHGPGSIHVLNMEGKGPFEGPDVEPGNVGVCVKCHDEVNSPEFDLAEYWPKIEH